MQFKLTAVILCSLLSLPLLATTTVPSRSLNFKDFKDIAIQQGGRVKPLDTFAREAVQTVTGKSVFKGIPAIDLIFSWMIFTRQWADIEMVEITSLKLKEKFSFAIHKKYFSVSEIQKSPKLGVAIRDIYEKNNREEKLTPFEQKIQRLGSQVTVFQQTASAELLTVIPNPKNIKDRWISLLDIMSSGMVNQYFSDLLSRSKVEELKVTFEGMAQAYTQNAGPAFMLTTTKFKQLLLELTPVQLKGLSLEVFYNDFRPFQRAWIFYLLGFVFLLLFQLTQKKLFYYFGFSSAAGAFLMHILGFVLRCSITGHPPVGTMYESVIWVSLGVVFFSFALLYQYKNIVVLTIATVVASVGLVLADNLPMVLDPTIRPLAPVLRSNFWLTIHVLTITLSYAAFALAMGIGNWALFKFLFPKGVERSDFQKLSQFNYRCIQIGVLLLASGTILGGVWADYSWGRFWGWDPKEVWALIALLFYLAIVHARYMGWLKDFGMAAASVIAFQGILMAWYGVNFVLGVGLHSYGFGSGGLSYVLGYVALQMLFILAAWFRFNGVKNKTI